MRAPSFSELSRAGFSSRFYIEKKSTIYREYEYFRYVFFVSTARRKVLFVWNAAKWKEEKTPSVKSAAHEKKPTTLSAYG
jgi:hypothetical protein